jgi:hypothetical protein
LSDSIGLVLSLSRYFYANAIEPKHSVVTSRSYDHSIKSFIRYFTLVDHPGISGPIDSLRKPRSSPTDPVRKSILYLFCPNYSSY